MSELEVLRPLIRPVIRLGRVLAGAVPFKQNNINDTFRGLVLTEEGERPAIIKDLEPKELANEVLVAAIALMLGLPVPEPVIAIASPDRLNACKGPEFGEGRLVYASIDVAQPQVAVLYNQGGGRKVLERLAQWKGLGRLYGLDALVANIDRHPGNILFSGDREIWIIDHGHCFTGPHWSASDLASPERLMDSRLQHWLTPILTYKQRTEKAEEAAHIEVDAVRIDLSGVAASDYLTALLTEGDLAAVLIFLNARCAHVPRLAATALDIGRLL
ncbi:hypothetical protein [Lichenihabitans psoromatis]|uniref:hypothetical protein n=1 Tax=Lichenihabitans psoromatis TaxID=2528642 RepID=UPI0010383EF7|nr:hypothetical protein [Lichenihabitans psoromatis]